MSKQVTALRMKIKSLASPDIAKTMQWFFKTGKGDYGEGDVFAGLKVPTQRKLAREFNHLKLSELKPRWLSRWTRSRCRFEHDVEFDAHRPGAGEWSKK